MSSRGMISARQRTSSYRPSNTPAAHVGQETCYIDSTSSVIHSVDGYYVQSAKFAQRYYRVAQDEQGQWGTSSTNEKVAYGLIKQVLEYIG